MKLDTGKKKRKKMQKNTKERQEIDNDIQEVFIEVYKKIDGKRGMDSDRVKH